MAQETSKDKNPGSGVTEAVQDAAEARTEVDTNGLAKGEHVDARLDNRVGADRPKRESFPAVPQQVDGPDLAHQAEFTRAYMDARDEGVKAGTRKGMHSPGPHGLGDESERVSGKTGDTGDLDALKKGVTKGFDSRRHN